MSGRASDRITSVANPLVKYARKLHRRRVREAEGRCLMEGVRLVGDALEAGASLVLGFWEATLLGQPGGEDLLARLRVRPPAGGFVEVNAQVMKEIADTETPQGIVVVADRPSPDPEVLLASEDAHAAATLVVLDNIRDPGNVGTVIRSANASGARGILFLPGTADPFGPKALRAAMGSTFHLPVVAGDHAVSVLQGRSHPGSPDRLSGRPDAGPPQGRTLLATRVPDLLRDYGYRVLVADAQGALPHWQADLSGRVALVLGGEGEGPDPALWGGAERVAIPLLGKAESLNVGMAAAVLLYEAARHREGWGRQP